MSLKCKYLQASLVSSKLYLPLHHTCTCTCMLEYEHLNSKFLNICKCVAFEQLNFCITVIQMMYTYCALELCHATYPCVKNPLPVPVDDEPSGGPGLKLRPYLLHALRGSWKNGFECLHIHVHVSTYERSPCNNMDTLGCSKLGPHNKILPTNYLPQYLLGVARATPSCGIPLHILYTPSPGFTKHINPSGARLKG